MRIARVTALITINANRSERVKAGRRDVGLELEVEEVAPEIEEAEPAVKLELAPVAGTWRSSPAPIPDPRPPSSIASFALIVKCRAVCHTRGGMRRSHRAFSGPLDSTDSPQ